MVAHDEDVEPTEKAKGKEKAENPPATETRSVLSRTTESAVGLGAALFSRPSGSNDLPNAGPSEKWRPSAQAPVSTGGEGSSSHRQPEPERTAGFRRQQQSVHTEQERDFSQFLHHPDVHADGRLRELAPSRLPRENRSSAIAAQEERDGVDVVHLLSQADAGFSDQIDDAGISGENLAPLRRALFEAGETGTTEWDNVLNFIPDFVRPDASGGYGGTETWKAAEARSALGLSHSPEAARLWVEQWTDVLTRYSDEVWGDLGSLVQEARSELERLAEPGGDGRTASAKALQRLRQVLGHIRYS